MYFMTDIFIFMTFWDIFGAFSLNVCLGNMTGIWCHKHWYMGVINHRNMVTIYAMLMIVGGAVFG